MVLLFFLLTIDARYHTLDEIAIELDTLAHCYPAITVLDTLGYSTTDSLPIFALKISDNADQREDEPRVLYVACHHAEEILGIEICMYMIQDLLSGYGSDSAATYWIDNREIWFVPLLNPEGHSVVMSGIDTTWRKNKRDNNNNGVFNLDYDGVDPNRNYDFHWAAGGSSNPGSEYYRGPGPFSENETQALNSLCSREHFTFCITYHSARTGLGEVVYYPWVSSGQSTYPPDFYTIRNVAISLARLIIKDDSSGHYTTMAGQGLDGKTRNWLYGVHGTFTYCVEVSTTTIQPGWMVDGICMRNLPGAYYLLERIEGSSITGHVFDATHGHPLAAEVIVHGNHVSYDANLPPRLSDEDHGRFFRIVAPDTYAIEIHQPGYVLQTIYDVIVHEGENTDVGAIFLEKYEARGDASGSENLRVYPNPAQEFVLIHMDDPSRFRKVSVYDVTGRMCRMFDSPFSSPIVWPGTYESDRTIANGVYYVVGEEIIDDRLPGPGVPDHILSTHKVIITR